MTTKLSDVNMIAFRGTDAASDLHWASRLDYLLRPRRPRQPRTTSTTSRAALPSSDHVDYGPRRPRPEQLRRAPTTSITRPRRNDDRHEERRYDNRDHRHDRSESSRTGQLHHRRSDFYPKISTLLIFMFNIIFHYDVSP